MTDTYCGKNCASCRQKDLLDCAGCKAGSHPLTAKCGIANCCRSKNHLSCSTCTWQESCRTLQKRSDMPATALQQMESEAAYQQQKQEEAAKKAAKLRQDASLLGKWLWLLFWLIIPRALASILTSDFVSGEAMRILGTLLSVAASFAYGLILLKLTPVDTEFRTAGFCYLAGSALDTAATLLSGGNTSRPWTLLLTVPAVIVLLVGQFHMTHTLSDALVHLDNLLSAKWLKLWKWFIISTVAVLGSTILVLIAPSLGLIVLLAALIANLAAGIMELSALYQTARLYREFPTRFPRYYD